MKVKYKIDKMSQLWDIEETEYFIWPVLMYEAARKEIHGWPIEVKKGLGEILWLLQKGESVGMPHIRQMPSVGKGVSEVRLKGPKWNLSSFLYDTVRKRHFGFSWL